MWTYLAVWILFSGAVAATAAFHDCSDCGDASTLLQVDKVVNLHQQAMVFYNLYVRSRTDIARISRTVQEQIAQLDPLQHRLWINSFGSAETTTQLGIDILDIIKENQTVFKHNRTGYEGTTLHDLWSFCRRKDTDQSQVVVYLHSKGSFHDKGYQKQWREYLTKGALSEECLTLPNQCNVCSTRISPLPHLHVPGNMWASRCDYVSRLVDPLAFEDAMEGYVGRAEKLDKRCKGRLPSCVGRHRYSYEHWVLSHPRAHPCDLDTSDKYVWSTPNGTTDGKDIEKSMNAFAQGVEGAKELKSVPRFGFARYASVAARAGCDAGCSYLPQRLEEYTDLYHEQPPPTWWGWNFFRVLNPKAMTEN